MNKLSILSSRATLAGFALTLFLAPATFAASIVGSLPLASVNVTQDGANLAVSDVITLSNIIAGNGQGDFSPILFPQQFLTTTLTFADLVANFRLTSAGTHGEFVPTSAVIEQRLANFVDITFLGVFTPGAGLPGLDPSDASVRVSVNQTGALSAAITMTAPPVPEPSTITLFAAGIALLGVGSLRRRTR